MNEIGDIRCMWQPPKIAYTTKPIRPMSWYSGSQPHAVARSGSRKLFRIANSLNSSEPCVTITPFGLPVDPLVYCKNATSLRAIAGSTYAALRPRSTVSVASSSYRRSDGKISSTSAICRTISVVVSTSPQSQSPRISSNRPIDRCSRVGSGGYVGTATVPLMMHAQNAVMKPRPSNEYSSTADRPAIFRRCSSAAIAVARVHSSRNVAVSPGRSPSSIHTYATSSGIVATRYLNASKSVSGRARTISLMSSST